MTDTSMNQPPSGETGQADCGNCNYPWSSHERYFGNCTVSRCFGLFTCMCPGYKPKLPASPEKVEMPVEKMWRLR